MSKTDAQLEEHKRVFGVAYKIAKKAHAGDFRDLPDARPYFEHVKDVAAFFPDWETKTVAILHDTIEDTRKKKPGKLGHLMAEEPITYISGAACAHSKLWHPA